MSSHCGSPDVGTSKPRGLFSYFSTALWDYNVALVQMLALCPALAVTTTATNGLGMGLATTLIGLPPPAVVIHESWRATRQLRIRARSASGRAAGAAKQRLGLSAHRTRVGLPALTCSRCPVSRMVAP